MLNHEIQYYTMSANVSKYLSMLDDDKFLDEETKKLALEVDKLVKIFYDLV